MLLSDLFVFSIFIHFMLHWCCLEYADFFFVLFSLIVILSYTYKLIYLSYRIKGWLNICVILFENTIIFHRNQIWQYKHTTVNGMSKFLLKTNTPWERYRHNEADMRKNDRRIFILHFEKISLNRYFILLFLCFLSQFSFPKKMCASKGHFELFQLKHK